MDTKQEVLQACKIEGNVVKLPAKQLERKLYQEVAKALELIGGKWKGHKISGFVFPQDPTELLAQIANGESRNLKKEYQFFATPEWLANRLVELAGIDNTKEDPEQLILEPSAGQGAIVNAIMRVAHPGQNVHCYELMDVNRMFLHKIEGVIGLGDDFLEAKTDIQFHKIIANPPFSKNQDIDHIRKMYAHLYKGGRLVSIASTHWQLSTNKKETEFVEWLHEVGAKIFPVPAGSFEESGTKVPTVIIVIDK